MKFITILFKFVRRLIGIVLFFPYCVICLFYMFMEYVANGGEKGIYIDDVFNKVLPFKDWFMPK